jgi:hypothetical protein
MWPKEQNVNTDTSKPVTDVIAPGAKGDKSIWLRIEQATREGLKALESLRDMDFEEDNDVKRSTWAIRDNIQSSQNEENEEDAEDGRGFFE